ncbi:MAG: c-type cytochrome [Halothiobacillaceae bacterium]|nr:MAG: c-type cytochrome [Halothiobacillaceae bacterium]
MRSTASLATALATTLGAALMFGSSAPALAAPSGQTIGLTCVVCHGQGGQGSGAIPPLAAKGADHLYQEMADFKSGKRLSTVMNRHARGYSDEELKAVADYFASLPAK